MVAFSQTTMSNKTVQIGPFEVGGNNPCMVVAEIGINHNGSLDIARRLIDMAVLAGCGAVKFQTRTVHVVYTAEELAKARAVPEEVIQNALKRGVLSPEAVKILTDNITNTTNGDLKRALEFGHEDYLLIDAYCKTKGILWFSSPWDEASVDLIEQFDPPCFKVASASLTDRGLLERIASYGRPVILGTGMSSMDQVRKAMIVLKDVPVIVSHTVSTYPAKRTDLNLRAITALQKEFGVPVAYSGHENGTTMSVCAVALGACVVERHITLDRTMYGSDQPASLEAVGLTTMIRNIRDFEGALGTGEKQILEAEKPISAKLRRVNTL